MCFLEQGWGKGIYFPLPLAYNPSWPRRGPAWQSLAYGTGRGELGGRLIWARQGHVREQPSPFSSASGLCGLSGKEPPNSAYPPALQLPGKRGSWQAVLPCRSQNNCQSARFKTKCGMWRALWRVYPMTLGTGCSHLSCFLRVGCCVRAHCLYHVVLFCH